MNPRQPAYHAFGLRWQSEVPLAAFEPCPQDDRLPDIEVVRSFASPPLRDAPFAAGNLARSPDGLRYTAGSIATIDTYGARRIQIHPGADWNDCLPPAFFGTVTGLLLAWRGLLPLHGSAVELDGRAILICGPSGAGKSTLAAALIAQGARLLSDDLSVLHPATPAAPASLFAGRRALRLFQSITEMLGRAVPWSSPPIIADRKLAVTPPRVNPRTPVPLSAVILLGAEPPLCTALTHQFFRPRWMRRIPGHRIRESSLLYATRNISVVHAPAVQVGDDSSFYRLGKSTLNFI